MSTLKLVMKPSTVKQMILGDIVRLSMRIIMNMYFTMLA